MRRFVLAILAALLAAPAAAQVNPTNVPASTVIGRTGIGPGPAQAIPFAIFTGNLLTALSGDCTASAAGAITCTKTNGVAYSPFATQAVPCLASQGCTGDTTLTAHGALIGEGTSAVNVTTAGGANSILMCGSSGCSAADPTFTALATTTQWINDTANLAPQTDQLWAAGAFTTITFGSTTTIDLSTLINGTITLTGNITTLNWSNCKAGQTGVIEFIQDGTGSRTVPAAWNSSFRWSGGNRGVLSTAINAVDWLFYQCKSSSVAFVSLQKGLAN